MTIIEEKIIRNGQTFKMTPTRKPLRPVPPPAPDIPPTVRTARRVAVTITAGIAVAAFLLSFAGLFGLAQQAGIPVLLAWLWPLTVDGTILQATVGIVAMEATTSQRERRFFWLMLVAAASVSVGGNVLHKLVDGPLPPVLAACVAAVAPLSLLATTHGLAILTRFNPNKEGQR